MMNKVMLIGRLTRDPDLRYTPSNIATVTFSIAVNRPFTNQNGVREADFINIIAWRKQAENVKKYITKGSLVAVEGRIQTRNYDDKDGKKVYVTEVVADNVQFLEPKGQRSMESNNNYEPSDNVQTTDVGEDPYIDFGQTVELSDDDIAF
ncbi:MAG: single-stranded DNA-binding protein [Tenericutes bacterium]|jgi:single-strand DNA-binding protein|nr:single-stranded DNA-binding protein [Bacilli bacterium]MDD3995196.1 single-stranded DNA-binding protein [Bacilli bacterium]MDD4623976.1 single-stranded DNA-binding protein [Bacilli bacterium]NLV90622.1 single-stranded DNA-binding protein [Mycoplasmatota bacterium]